MISVTIQSPNIVLGDDWDDLVARAQPNVFMSPAALRAADRTMFSKVHVLLAWDDSVQPRRLVGLWAMQERRTWALGPAVLDALPFEYAFLSSPVIDQARVVEVMPAFVTAIADSPTLPRVIVMKSLDIESASYQPMIEAIDGRGGRSLTIKTESRPVIWRGTVEKPSGERRKKLRQNWKRMSAIGVTAMIFATEPEAVAAAVETFLHMEFKSWKGAAGTALLCRDEDATFVRRLIANLAAQGQAGVQSLQIDGQTIATQVLLFSGKMAYTWKTAFDQTYAKFSPGVTLIDRLTDHLFQTTKINGIDSCSTESSFMAQIWPARRAMADLLVDVKPGVSLGFWLEATRQVGRERLKTLRAGLITRLKAYRSKPPVPGLATVLATEALTTPPKPSRTVTPVGDRLRHETAAPPLADAAHPFHGRARSDA